MLFAIGFDDIIVNIQRIIYLIAVWNNNNENLWISINILYTQNVFFISNHLFICLFCYIIIIITKILYIIVFWKNKFFWLIWNLKIALHQSNTFIILYFLRVSK